MSNKKDNSKIQEISQQNIISNLSSDHLQTKIATLLFESNSLCYRNIREIKDNIKEFWMGIGWLHATLSIAANQLCLHIFNIWNFLYG